MDGAVVKLIEWRDILVERGEAGGEGRCNKKNKKQKQTVLIGTGSCLLFDEMTKINHPQKVEPGGITSRQSQQQQQQQQQLQQQQQQQQQQQEQPDLAAGKEKIEAERHL